MSSSEWKSYKLGQIIDDIAMGPFGSNIKVDNFIDSGVPVIRGSNFNEGGFEEDKFVFISEKKAQSLRRSLAFPDDLVFTHRGTIGQVGLIPKDKHDKYLVSQSQMRLTVNKKYLNPLFLYYFFKSPIGQYELLKNSSQVGVPAIAQPTTSLKEIDISIPNLIIQSRIANILFSLDEKIELNRQTNATLEAIAQAIFKEWFIDFNFPGSTGEMIESELGLIPNGWRVGKIGDLFHFVIGGDWGKDEYSSEFSNKCYVIRGTDLDKIWSGNLNFIPQRFIKSSSKIKRELKEGDIIIEISGGSKEQATGRNIFFLNGLLDLFDQSVVPTSFCRLIRPLNLSTSIFLGTFLRIFYKEGKTWDFQLQSTGISNFQFVDFSNRLQIIIPYEQSLHEFMRKVLPIYQMIFMNNKQINKLTKIRDLLLPKLMNGEIEV